MRRDPQRGMTLVELLVAMAVTSILLVGLGSVFFNVSGQYESWAHRIQTASVGAALAANLQTDSHRYLHCDGTPVSTPLPTDMALCMPDDRANADAMVTYHVTGSGPWVITRQVGARTAFMLRSNTRPFFWIDCLDQDGQTVSGHVHVYNLRLSSDSLDPNSAETFSVYYVAPRSGSRGC